MKKEQDRYLGCLMGLAVGDALGAPVEFLSLSEIKGVTGRMESAIFLNGVVLILVHIRTIKRKDNILLSIWRLGRGCIRCIIIDSMLGFQRRRDG